MLSPKRTKYRKYHRGRMRGKKTRGNEICFGNFGLQALEPTWITSRQIEAARRTITRYTKRGAKLSTQHTVNTGFLCHLANRYLNHSSLTAKQIWRAHRIRQCMATFQSTMVTG